MNKKLIIITPTEFTKKEFDKNSIKSFLQKKIKVEIWVIPKTYHVDYKIDKKIIYKHKNLPIKVIKSINDLDYHLNKIKEDNLSYLIDLRVRLTLRSIPFFKTFFSYNFNYIVLPGLVNTKTSLHYDLYLKILNFMIWINFLFLKVKIKPAKYVYLISKENLLVNNMLISKKSKVISGHHADYDRYLQSQKQIQTKSKIKYFVFLDQNVPNHPDLIRICSGAKAINEKKYYISLIEFFKKVEKEFKYRCIVCKHPRTNTKIIKKYFGNMLSSRPALELVRDCEFTITHDSVGTNFSFLYNKPIVSIINDELLNHEYPHKKEMEMFCRRAKIKKIIDISKDKLTKKDLVFNPKDYKNFIQKYIKSNNIKSDRAGIILKNARFT